MSEWNTSGGSAWAGSGLVLCVIGGIFLWSFLLVAALICVVVFIVVWIYGYIGDQKNAQMQYQDPHPELSDEEVFDRLRQELESTPLSDQEVHKLCDDVCRDFEEGRLRYPR